MNNGDDMDDDEEVQAKPKAEEIPPEPEIDQTTIKRKQRAQLELDYAAFLASGRTPTVIPPGDYSQEFISAYSNKESREQRKRKYNASAAEA